MAAKSSPASNQAASNQAARKQAAGPRVVAAPEGAATASATALDRIIHERLRLAIVSALSVNPILTFAELKKLLATTDGNLSVHSRKLEDAGYIAVEKKFEGRVPRTEYRLTAEGRAALERYLTHMEALIRATRNA
jgi:DNA-binding MarR family transcriptional regulator